MIQDELKERGLLLNKKEIDLVIVAMQEAVEEVIKSNRTVKIGEFVEIIIKDNPQREGISGVGHNKGEHYIAPASTRPSAKIIPGFISKLRVKKEIVK